MPPICCTTDYNLLRDRCFKPRSAHLRFHGWCIPKQSIRCRLGLGTFWGQGISQGSWYCLGFFWVHLKGLAGAFWFFFRCIWGLFWFWLEECYTFGFFLTCFRYEPPFVQATLGVGSVKFSTVDFGGAFFNWFCCVLCVLSDTLVWRCMMFIFCVKEADWGVMAFVAYVASWFSE